MSDVRAVVTGLQSSKKEDVLKACNTLRACALQALGCTAGDVNLKPVKDNIASDYITSSPSALELFNLWGDSYKRKATALLAPIVDAIAALLRFCAATSGDDGKISKTVVFDISRNVITSYLPILYYMLTSGQPYQARAALRLLVSMASCNSNIALNLVRRFDFDLKGFNKLHEIISGVSHVRSDNSYLICGSFGEVACELYATLLQYHNASITKIVLEHSWKTTVFHHLPFMNPQLYVHLCSVMNEHVLKFDTAMREIDSVFSTSCLCDDTKNKDESKGLTANEKNAMTKAAYELLMAVFSDATVFDASKSRDPAEPEDSLNPLIACVHQLKPRPNLVLAPKLSWNSIVMLIVRMTKTWPSTVNAVYSALLPLSPPSKSDDVTMWTNFLQGYLTIINEDDVASTSSSVIPACFRRSAFDPCLRHSDPSIRFHCMMLVVALLRRCWISRVDRDTVSSIVKSILPDIQTWVLVYNQELASIKKLVKSDKSEQFEFKRMMYITSCMCLVYYCKIIPEALVLSRFDVAKLYDGMPLVGVDVNEKQEPIVKLAQVTYDDVMMSHAVDIADLTALLPVNAVNDVIIAGLKLPAYEVILAWFYATGNQRLYEVLTELSSKHIIPVPYDRLCELADSRKKKSRKGNHRDDRIQLLLDITNNVRKRRLDIENAEAEVEKEAKRLFKEQDLEHSMEYLDNLESVEFNESPILTTQQVVIERPTTSVTMESTIVRRPEQIEHSGAFDFKKTLFDAIKLLNMPPSDNASSQYRQMADLLARHMQHCPSDMLTVMLRHAGAACKANDNDMCKMYLINVLAKIVECTIPSAAVLIFNLCAGDELKPALSVNLKFSTSFLWSSSVGSMPDIDVEHFDSVLSVIDKCLDDYRVIKMLTDTVASGNAVKYVNFSRNILEAYSGTLSRQDRLRFSILRKLERLGIEPMGPVCPPVLWGLMKAGSYSPSDVYDSHVRPVFEVLVSDVVIDSSMMMATRNNFPYDCCAPERCNSMSNKIDPLTADYLYNSSGVIDGLIVSADSTISSPAREIYDPYYLLYYGLSLMNTVHGVHPLRLLESQLVSIAILACAADDEQQQQQEGEPTVSTLRRLAEAFMSRYSQLLTETDEFIQKSHISVVVNAMMTVRRDRLSHPMASFLSECVLIVIKPAHPFFLPVQRALLDTPVLSPDIIPHLMSYCGFHYDVLASALHNKTEAVNVSTSTRWMLSVVSRGVRTLHDYINYSASLTSVDSNLREIKVGVEHGDEHSDPSDLTYIIMDLARAGASDRLLCQLMTIPRVALMFVRKGGFFNLLIERHMALSAPGRPVDQQHQAEIRMIPLLRIASYVVSTKEVYESQLAMTMAATSIIVMYKSSDKCCRQYRQALSALVRNVQSRALCPTPARDLTV